jgi:hypothetical protein
LRSEELRDTAWAAYAAVLAATKDRTDELNAVLAAGREEPPQVFEGEWWLDDRIVFGEGAMN